MAADWPEKRKRGLRYGFPWWTLVLVFLLGVVITLLVVRPGASSTDISADVPEGIRLTATAIIQEATRLAPTLAP